MTDISNKLHITQNSKKNIGNNFDDNEDLVKTFQHLPENPEAISRKAEAIKKQKEKEEKEKIERWEITDENLLNKPNMTAKDKEWMQKAIYYLVENNMDTVENLQKLDAIIYTQKSIEIWGVKRARKDITAKPNGKRIFEYNGVTYFQRSKEMIQEQNELLAKQDMEIPLDSYYEKSLQVLPGEYDRWDRYKWWNILALIVDIPMDGYCGEYGKLYNEYIYGHRWSASPKGNHDTRNLMFDKYWGGLRLNDQSYAFPIRPVLK